MKTAYRNYIKTAASVCTLLLLNACNKQEAPTTSPDAEKPADRSAASAGREEFIEVGKK